ncbi:hypothetical protein MMO01_29150, partial [Escherichia coli]|nr:hypothetical protein [Escherichia coli]
LVTMGVMVQSAVNAWLKDKSYQIVDITHAIQKRVDTWRYVTWRRVFLRVDASLSGEPVAGAFGCRADHPDGELFLTGYVADGG